jgi:hypothetical protein
MKKWLIKTVSRAIAWLISAVIVVPMLTAMAIYALSMAARERLNAAARDG